MLVLVYCDKDKKMYIKCTCNAHKSMAEHLKKPSTKFYGSDIMKIACDFQQREQSFFLKSRAPRTFCQSLGFFFIDISFLSFSSFHHFVCSCGKTHCVTSLNVIDLNVLVADDERLIMIADRLFFFLAMFCYWFLSPLVCILFFRSQSLISPSPQSTI